MSPLANAQSELSELAWLRHRHSALLVETAQVFAKIQRLEQKQADRLRAERDRWLSENGTGAQPSMGASTTSESES